MNQLLNQFCLFHFSGSEDRISDATVISSASSQSLPWPASSANGHSPSADHHRNGSNENLNNIDTPPVVTSSQSPVTSLAATPAAKLSNGVSQHSNGGSAVNHHSNGDLDYMEKMDSGLEMEKRGKVSNSSLPRDTSKKSRDSSKMTKEDQVI